MRDFVVHWVCLDDPLHRKPAPQFLLLFPRPQASADAAASTFHLWGELDVDADDLFSRAEANGGAEFAHASEFASIAKASRTALAALAAEAAAPVSVLELLLDLDVRLE